MQDSESQADISHNLHQNQEPLNPLDTTSADLDQHIDPIFNDPQTISTRLRKLAQADLNLRSTYRLDSKILMHTPITQNMRARLRSFLMAQTSKQCILRQTCVLACSLVDLYFKHQGQVEINQFQNLVIGCLILATKLKEGKFPMISYNIFSRQQLLTYQKKVAKRLAYQLMPITYYDYAQKVIYLWDHFTNDEHLYNIKLGQCKTGVNVALRKFYQQLDCIFMVLKTLDYDIECLVLNLFYLNVRIININQQLNVGTLNEENFQLTLYNPSDNFHKFYTRFLQSYSSTKLNQSIKLQLDPKMGYYLRYFLGVTSTQKEWAIKGNAQALQKIRNWDMIQTVPKDNYPLAKNVIQRVNKTSKK